MVAHLDSSTGPGDDDLVFTSPTGTPLRHGNFRRRGGSQAELAKDQSKATRSARRRSGAEVARRRKKAS